MRTWRDLAAPDDPRAWYAVSNMLPTHRGTYQTGPVTTSFTQTATGTGNVIYAFAGKTLASVREYVLDDASHIWEAGTTDRAGGVVVGGFLDVMMAQYGDVTICVMGTANPTVKSTGANFSALAGAPQGTIIVVQSNAVLVFNTSTSADGWAASDVGDYTNWATGEAASGRIIATPGAITAAVPYGNDVFVFKGDSIYRMTYVGGVVKWQIQLVWNGIGCYADKFSACATSRGIAFNGSGPAVTQFDGLRHEEVYIFNGSSAPVLLNPETTIGYGTSGQLIVYMYDARTDLLCLAPGFGSNASGLDGNGAASRYFYFHLGSGAWGATNGGSNEGSTSGTGVVQGTLRDSQTNTSPRPGFWKKTAANTLTRTSPQVPADGLTTFSSSCYLQTSKVGRIDAKTTFTRLTPLLRRRRDGGTDSAALSMELWRELDDTSAQSTTAVTESTSRRRFDLLSSAATDNFARFKVTWTDLDVEVDDFLVASSPAGTD